MLYFGVLVEDSYFSVRQEVVQHDEVWDLSLIPSRLFCSYKKKATVSVALKFFFFFLTGWFSEQSEGENTHFFVFRVQMKVTCKSAEVVLKRKSKITSVYEKTCVKRKR